MLQSAYFLNSFQDVNKNLRHPLPDQYPLSLHHAHIVKHKNLLLYNHDNRQLPHTGCYCQQHFANSSKRICKVSKDIVKFYERYLPV